LDGITGAPTVDGNGSTEFHDGGNQVDHMDVDFPFDGIDVEENHVLSTGVINKTVDTSEENPQIASKTKNKLTRRLSKIPMEDVIMSLSPGTFYLVAFHF
jgi:hypothetical protein